MLFPINRIKEIMEMEGITLEKSEVEGAFEVMGIDKEDFTIPNFKYCFYTDPSFSDIDRLYGGKSGIEVEGIVGDEFAFDSNRIGKYWENKKITLLWVSSDGKAESGWYCFLK